MAGAGRVVHSTFDVPGLSASQASARVEAAMQADEEYRGGPLGPVAFQYVRTYRPTWALVLAIVTAPFLGLGLLLLFVRRTESCSISVVTSSRGVLVTVAGHLLPGRLERLQAIAEGDHALHPSPTEGAAAPSSPGRAGGPSMVPAFGAAPAAAIDPPPARVPAFQGASAPAPAPVPARTAAPAPAVPAATFDGDTVARRPRPPARPAAGPASAAARFGLRLPDGSVVPVDGPLVLGRNPRPVEGVPAGAQRLALDDPARQVSATHALVVAEGGDLWVEDLHSTNGTTVRADGRAVALQPRTRVRVAPGAELDLAGLRAQVVASRHG